MEESLSLYRFAEVLKLFDDGRAKLVANAAPVASGDCRCGCDASSCLIAAQRRFDREGASDICNPSQAVA